MTEDQKDNADLNDQHLRDHLEISQLAGSLAHEIKNPLSVIRMNMDLLAEDLAEASNPREHRLSSKVQVVQSQCQRLQTLLDDFLKFVRVREMDMKAGSLNEQLERVLDFLAPKAVQAEIAVNRYLDPDAPSIMMDAARLYAALMNLVLNAIEATPAGGTIEVFTRLTSTGVALDLIDNGCGMQEQMAIHMFDPFFTTKENGSGLGLPIARRIIEAHGGRIAVQTVVGRGTQFTLEFPTPARLTSGSDQH